MMQEENLQKEEKKSSYELFFDIPVGPQHPALKEPAFFKFKVEGEKVTGVDVDVSYNHRGIEKALEQRNYIQNIYLIERICGICNVAHTLCYAQAVEQLYGKEIPTRANYIRLLIEELARIHSHMLWLGVAAHEIGFDTLFMYVWRDREVVMDLIEMLTGNRVTTAINTIGGVRRDISDEAKDKVRKGMNILEERLKYYRKVALNDPTVNARCSGVGILKPRDAIKLCAVGPTLRASGIKNDVRKDDSYALHDEVPFNVITYDTMDVLARVLVRVDETLESVNMVKYCLDHMPSGDVRIKLPLSPPVGEAVSRVEAPRGELIHYVRSNGTKNPERYKVRTPTFGNIPSVCGMLTSKGDYEVNIADIPIVLASIDPCFSCTARMEFRDVSKDKTWIWSLEELKAYCKRQGSL
jgi:NADH-quinone oxidoreductase subunit D